jgi:fengycin family lipopeptide synthetase D
MSIEMAGGVYCPLSPRDPKQRLHTLIEQTQSHVVLVHYMTQDKFENDIITVDIDAVVNNNVIINNDDLDRLSSIKVTSESMAYVIFTSGSTGTPKAVSFHAKKYFHVFLIVYLNLGSSETEELSRLHSVTSSSGYIQ